MVRYVEQMKHTDSKLDGKIHRKKGKIVEVCRSVRDDMRRLAGLYCNFLKDEFTLVYKNALDMFSRANFESLLNAIEIYTTSDEGVEGRFKTKFV